MEDNEKDDRESLVKLENPQERELDNPQYNYPPPSKKEKIFNIFLISILSLLIISILIFFSVYFLLSNKSTTTNKKDDEDIMPKPICDIGEEEKCLTCHKTKNECNSCNPGYYLLNGTCIINYSFKAIYQSTTPNETIFLFNNIILGDINQILINGENTSITNNYTFPEVGEHTVHFLINITGKYFYSLNRMFSEITKMKLIKFTYLFDTKDVSYMTDMFQYCSSLTSIEISSFNTQSVKDMQNMFQGCSSLTFLNLSNFDTHLVENMESMFNGCNSLTSLIISNFITFSVTSMNSMFLDCYSLKSIDISIFDTQ